MYYNIVGMFLNKSFEISNSCKIKLRLTYVHIISGKYKKKTIIINKIMQFTSFAPIKLRRFTLF